jgi:8-oxo-dGTP diphosphatase
MPEATVAAIIWRSKDGVSLPIEILLTKRNYPPFEGLFCLPGGHIEVFELADEAITREVKEETGLDFKGIFQGKSEEIYPEMNIHNIALVYSGRAKGEVKCNEEVAEYRWVPYAEAEEMKLAFGHERILETYSCIFNRAINK